MDQTKVTIMPLGAGQEVGRSCILVKFENLDKSLSVLLDMGIHPALGPGFEALPYLDHAETDQIDMVLVSHHHLDHCGALPWFLTKTTFRGRCLMTPATKAIYKWMLTDYIKVSGNSTEQLLYSEADLKASMDKIEVINFHETKEISGLRISAYHAGHALGACQFLLEFAGSRIHYTGDFSLEEDRHLMAAEIPKVKSDVLIIESTYGTHLHESKSNREKRLLKVLSNTIKRHGKTLIPVFAIGRAQELLLILEEFWSEHKELQEIPIYYASSLAEKCMSVFQTHVSAMNDNIKRQIAVRNPFVFKHILDLRSVDNFDDCGPCVVLASPGMMQSGLSRQLFEKWCGDPRNTCLIAGYCCEGTLAKHVLSEPDEILSMDGVKLNRKCQVEYISFSAHADYKQTSEFVRALHPPHIVLVHGAANEMSKLKQGLTDQYMNDENPIVIHTPKNTQAVELTFQAEKTAKVIGSLAVEPPEKDKLISGVLVRRNFNYHLMNPSDLKKYTDLCVSCMSQTMTVSFQNSLDVIKQLLDEHNIEFEQQDNYKICVERKIELELKNNIAYLEWSGGPNEDSYVEMLTALLTKYSVETNK